jgi:hypothetical protein
MLRKSRHSVKARRSDTLLPVECHQRALERLVKAGRLDQGRRRRSTDDGE